ncbi:hypothetical protein GCM10027592_29200 [Spirosoma flavus]
MTDFSAAFVNTIINENCLTGLGKLPDSIANCCVTSPPYFALRDYSNEEQIGLEDTPEQYIQKLVEVFRQVRRVLKSDGTLWLNIGDSYWGGKGKSGQSYSAEYQNERYNAGRSFNGAHHQIGGINQTRPTDRKHSLYKPKDLIGIPWRLAFALQADGWYLRQDIIWHKPNPMPESVVDRCTKSHEYLFLLSKSAKYYYDAEAIKEPVTASTIARLDQDLESQAGSNRIPGKTNGPMKAVGVRPQLKRAIELANQHGLTDAHFDAIRSVGLSDAGQSKLLQSGAGKNSEEVIRLAEEAKAALGGYYREFVSAPKKSGNKERKPGSERGCPENSGSNVCSSIPWEGITRNKRSVWTVATKPFKDAHFATFPPELIIDCIKAGSPPGGLILDPFMGAGTTAMVARKLGRNYLGYELNPDYIQIAQRRLHGELGLFQ